MPTTEGTGEMSLDAANKAAISMVKDHPKNLHWHELKLHALSAKAERLLWHQRLGHCGNEQLCRAHMFSDGVPEIRLGKDSALDSCLVCLAANMKSRNRGDGETRTATKPGQGLPMDFCLRDNIQRMPRIRNKCESMITWVSTGNMLSGVVQSRNGMTGRSMSTVEGATYCMAEEVAHEERKRQCERLIRLHGSGRRVMQIQSN